MPTIETSDGTQLYYKDWGSGPPCLFSLGWPLNADMWEYQTPYLASQGFRCIAYDRRGFGRSSQPWDGYDYDTFADDLAALIDRLGLTGVTLVGFSMGGGEVARYLARHGTDRIAKAVLISAVTPFLLKTPDHPKGADKGVFDTIIAGLNDDRPHFLANFAKAFYGVGLISKPVSTETLQWSLNLAMQASPKGTIDCVRAFGQTDFRPDMRAFTVPTLIVHGDADATVPIDVTARVAVQAIPRARLIEYAGAPHGLFVTEKDRLNGDLLDFFRS